MSGYLPSSFAMPAGAPAPISSPIRLRPCAMIVRKDDIYWSGLCTLWLIRPLCASCESRNRLHNHRQQADSSSSDHLDVDESIGLHSTKYRYIRCRPGPETKLL